MTQYSGLMDTIQGSSTVIDTVKWTFDEVKYAIDAVHQSVAAGCANDQPKNTVNAPTVPEPG